MKRVMQSMAHTVLLALAVGLAVMAIVHPASAQQGKEYFVD